MRTARYCLPCSSVLLPYTKEVLMFALMASRLKLPHMLPADSPAMDRPYWPMPVPSQPGRSRGAFKCKVALSVRVGLKWIESHRCCRSLSELYYMCFALVKARSSDMQQSPQNTVY